jgi:hypothetical protein
MDRSGLTKINLTTINEIEEQPQVVLLSALSFGGSDLLSR